ncbi:CASP-like protein 2C2 [Oryza brachyantha]|uniref:CASP-like protein 2C2 n=1 Tax=Oryza brachyantha TaxID=4533 RepID=UPI001ADB6A1F|nr:CASP-like protein 2C2 [Oryza brachyantha]
MAAAAPGAVRAERLLRGACVVMAATAALLLGFSEETETVLFVRKTAVAKDVQALWVLTVAAAAAAGYHFAQLIRCLYCSGGGAMAAAWTSFLLDKGCAYVVFASTAAALQACMVGLAGVDAVQWSKLCNIYTRFCEQAAAGMLCSLLAAGGMAVLSAFSARRLFRLYSPAAARRSSTS